MSEHFAETFELIVRSEKMNSTHPSPILLQCQGAMGNFVTLPLFHLALVRRKVKEEGVSELACNSVKNIEF